MTGRYKVLATIQGTRDGVPWPPPGRVIELPTSEGDQYARNGYVEPAEPEPEATEPEPEPEATEPEPEPEPEATEPEPSRNRRK